MFNEEDDEESFKFEVPEEHPQFSILKRHIERSVQDLFLDCLRAPSSELLYVFTQEEQIDVFINRILKYWEDYENYEVCQEVVSLSKKCREEWKNISATSVGAGLARIKDLFNTNTNPKI